MAARVIAGITAWCRRIPAGTAMIPATSPVIATEQVIMASVCRGVMPRALNTPMSWARSRIWSATVFSTPRPATAMISSVSIATRATTASRALPPPLAMSTA